jgi:hypothetical protein
VNHLESDDKLGMLEDFESPSYWAKTMGSNTQLDIVKHTAW